ncbi:hypothetical protein C1645_856011 [Glomus cerebriforme]|uniref:CCHC-type domain-containing protein n=1 Tax=Glomus cerebriforme TaxID=658196 RepID=A0A397TPL8_9GLOM|nr:hypothetical protein C1645_856011 [Glomus cerebriforme]
MGINISTEEVAIFEGFGAKQVQEQDNTLLLAGITPEEQDVIIREFLNINGATAALIRTIATLVHAKTKGQTESLCQAEYIANLLGDKNEIKQLQEQITLLTNKYIETEQTAKAKIEELSNKLLEVTTDKNTLQNAYGDERAIMVTKEIGYFESKEHYRDLDESDYASSIRNESDDESMTESLTNRFRNLEIPQSIKAKGKRPEGKVDEPMEVETKNEKGNSLNNSIHATKKKNQHKENQSFQKHVLGVNCAACGVNKEELMQLIKEDMITCNISYEQIKEIFVNHNNHMTVTVAQLSDANKIMMKDHGRKYKYVKLYELNQTIGHTKILLKNVSKHVTREMLVKAVEENIGTIGDLEYKMKKANIDVEVEVEVQIPDTKFRDIWSIACNGYRIEVQQMNTDSEEMFKKRRRFSVKIKNLPPNTTDQHLEGDLLTRHAKYWKVYKVNEERMEALVLFKSEKDKNLATSKKVKVNNKEYEWWMGEQYRQQQQQQTQHRDQDHGRRYRGNYCGICKKNNHRMQDCYFNKRKGENYCSICRRRGHANETCYYNNNNNRSRVGNGGPRISFQERQVRLQYRGDERRGQNNNGRQEFFRTGANRVPINRPRIINQSGTGRTYYNREDQYNNGRPIRGKYGYNDRRYSRRDGGRIHH